MVENPINFSQYGEAIEKINKRKKSSDSQRSVVLFFSYDIVNSSTYKDIDTNGWPIVLSAILTKLQNEVTKYLPNAQLWRVLGDEMIFFLTIREKEEIYSTIECVYQVLIALTNNIKNDVFTKELNEKNREYKFVNSTGLISLQAAAWLAIVVREFNEDIERYDNVFKKYELQNHFELNDFLGQDIDTGFRIKKETQDRRLVVSIELATILSEKTDYLSNLHIITYKNLKGVWKNRLYPIIWYYDAKLNLGIPFEDSFYYDETKYSELSKEYFLNRRNGYEYLSPHMFNDVNMAINKVLKDQNMKDKIEKIYSVINSMSTDMTSMEDVLQNNLLELHLAAVCCDVKSRKVLIAKRKSTKKLMANLWEFGCAKATNDLDIIESIKKEYRNDFGIEIEIVCNNSRLDVEPVPIALYQVEKVEKKQKGVIVIAKIIGGIENIKDTIASGGKHEEFRFISQNEVDDYQLGSVSDFCSTLNQVFDKWDIYMGET